MFKKTIILLVLILFYTSSISANKTMAASPAVVNIDLSNVRDLGSGNVCVEEGKSFYIDATASDADGFTDIQWLKFVVNNKVGNTGFVTKRTSTPHDNPAYYEGLTTSSVWVPNPVSENYKCSSFDGSPYWNSCTLNFICLNTDGSVTLSNTTDEDLIQSRCPGAMYAFTPNRVERGSSTELVVGWTFKPIAPLDTEPGLIVYDFAGNTSNGGNWTWDDKWLYYPCPAVAPALNTTTTLSVNNPSPVVGSQITFSGILKDSSNNPVANKVIKLVEPISGATIKLSSSTTDGVTHNTDSSGAYVIGLTITASNSFSAYAKFDGDASYTTSQSSQVTVTPTLAPLLVTSNCQLESDSAIARIVSGLLTVGSNTTTGRLSSTNGQCVIDLDRVPFAPDKILNYNELKSIYFQQR